jgi:hypothetical protein
MMPEQIWILLLFLLVVLVNLTIGFLNRRRERGAVDKEKSVHEPAPRAPRARAGVATAPPRVDVSRPAPPPTHLRRRPVSLRGADLRRAIVVMTVLGPPRALEDQAHR